MSEEITGTQEPTTEGEQTPENQQAISEDVMSELPDEVQKTIKSLTAQKEHFRDKYSKADGSRQELQDKIDTFTKPKEEEKPEEKKDSASDDEWKARMEFAMKHQGDVDMSDLDKIVSISKIEGKTLDETLESDLYKGYLTAKEANASQANTVPQAGSESPVVGKNDDFSKVTAEDIPVMDKETFEKYQVYLKNLSPNQR